MKKLTRDRVVPTISDESFLTNLRDYDLGHAFLSEMSKQEQNPS